MIGKTCGPWFRIYSAYMFPVILIACFIYLRAMFRMWRLYRRQTFVLLIGMILPYVANTAYITSILPFNYDISPPAFSVCGIFYTWGLFRFELFDACPPLNLWPSAAWETG